MHVSKSTGLTIYLDSIVWIGDDTYKYKTNAESSTKE